MATIIVTSTGDTTANDGVTTLREALDMANNGDVIQLQSSTTYSLNSSLTVDKEVTITVTGDSTITGSGGPANLNVTSGGDLTLENVTYSAGGIDVASGGALELNSVVLSGGGLTSSGTVDANDFTALGTVSVNAGTTTLTNAKIVFVFGDGAVVNAGTLNMVDSTINDASGSGVVANGGTFSATNVTIEGNGDAGVDVDGGTANLTNVTLTGNDGGLVNNGTVNLTNVLISGNTNFGGLDVSGANMATDNGGNVLGGDPATIFASIDPATGGGELASNGGAIQTVALLNDPSNPALDVGFSGIGDARGDPRFDLAGVGNDGMGFADAGAFELSCFAEGTMIETSTGKRAVETLAIGDLVSTADGRDVPVVWLGVQNVGVANSVVSPNAPVCLAKGALGSFPSEALILTGDHALVLDNLLINASCLVGLPGIDWAAEEDRVFYRIETEAHEVLLANDTPAESFCDVCGRGSFDNGKTAVARIVPMMPLPRISARRLLPAHVAEQIAGKSVETPDLFLQSA